MMIAVDAHVHFYDGYDFETFLSSAIGNLTHNLGVPRESASAAGVLCLTESAGCNFFQTLCNNPEKLAVQSDWRITPTQESCSVLVETPELYPIAVIAGHQIVTLENIEVLVLGRVDKPADGSPAEELIEQLLAEDISILVLPWGFGKWFGERGKLIRRLIEKFGSQLAVGDNSGRLAMTPQPGLIKLAQTRGILNLVGSDPLPISGEEKTVGRLVNRLDTEFDRRQPFAQLKKLLWDGPRSEIRGNHETMFRFVKHQCLMQLRK